MYISICVIWKYVCDVLELFVVRYLFIFLGIFCTVFLGKDIVLLYSCILVFMKAAKSFILQGIKLYWQKMWNTSPDGYHLKLFQPSVNLRPSYLFITNRREQLHIHHLRLGRSKLNDQDPIQKKERKDKLCNICMEIEDTSHFLLKCTRYSIERRVLFLNIDEIYNRYNIASKDRIYNELILGDNSFIPKNASLEILQHVINYVKMTIRLS